MVATKRREREIVQGGDTGKRKAPLQVLKVPYCTAELGPASTMQLSQGFLGERLPEGRGGREAEDGEHVTVCWLVSGKKKRKQEKKRFGGRTFREGKEAIAGEGKTKWPLLVPRQNTQKKLHR